MGDVLPLKRQAVVERLKRRFELYRRHQNACLPRYEQAANGLYEAQKQETLVLKQRFLESKAKKSKTNKSDHHRSYKESATDSQKSQLHVKALKRPAEEPSTNAGPDCANAEDTNKPAKITRTDTSADKASAPDLQAQQPSLPTYSVQIVQQFTKAPHSQQSQTIQTSVTVQTLPKPLNSPLSQAPQTIATNQQVQESGANADRSQTTPVVNTVECKQEKDCVPSDLCQFKSNQSSNGDSGGGDRLADTFPSLGFADDSGDDVIHPELLKHIIEDVMTSEDLMKEFNFEDSVGSIKDQEDAAKDIIDLVKVSSPGQSRPFQTDGLSFGNSQANQNPQNGLFRSISAGNETSMTVMSTTTTTPSTTASPFYTTPSQGLPSYGNSALSLPARLSLDFKLTEPSPAALTLKQMAEQHQNMQKQQQQQQLVNSPLTNRPSPFSQDSFTSHLNPLRSAGYLNGSNSALTSNSPKTPNAGTNIFGPFDRQINNFPGTEDLNSFPGCEPLTSNLFESDIRSRNSVVLSDADRAKQQRLQVDPSCHQMEQKPPAYGATRPLTHYSENAHMRPQNPLAGQHQRPMARQFQNNLQMTQSQHMHAGLAQHNAQRLQQNSHDPKQQQHNLMQPHPNMYGNYAPQQPASSTFHVALTQSVSYSSQFASNQSINRPPPEYKPQHHNIAADNLHLVEQLNSPSHMMFTQPSKNKYLNKNQRPPNVTITPDGTAIAPGSSDWRHNMMNQQPQNQFRMGSFPHQETYGDLMRNERLGVSAAPAPMYNQYRMPGNQMNTNRVVRPNMVPPNHILLQQRQRVPTPQGPRNPSMGEMDQHPSMSLNNNALSPTSVMGPVFTNQQDMTRQDGSQINLDFLDHIESSASDLLNFDNVMQGGGTSFPLLDDM